MGIGRIASLLGSLVPSAGAEQAQPELDKSHQAVAALVDPQANRHATDGRSEAESQIHQVIGAIQRLHEVAAEDGAGMAFSHTGASLRDTVTGLGHLLATARDTGAPLSEDVRNGAAQAVGKVEGSLPAIQAAIQQRLDTMPAANAAKAAQSSRQFLDDMQTAIAQVRAVLTG